MPEASGFSATELKKFSEAGRVIAAAVGVSVETWARAEAGVILKTWAGRTKVAPEKRLERGGLLRAYREARRKAGFSTYKGGVEPGQASINLGIRGPFGRVWYRTRTPGRRFQMAYGKGFSSGRRVPNADWPGVSALVSDFRAHYAGLVAAAKRAAGLSRQSIVQIADDLGIRLEDVKGGGNLSGAGIAKARNALASNGQHYRNGYGIVGQTAREFFVTLVNRYPKIGALFMDVTLQGVIAGRLAYFQRHLEEGTFVSAKEAARAYPYVEVLRLAA